EAMPTLHSLLVWSDAGFPEIDGQFFSIVGGCLRWSPDWTIHGEPICRPIDERLPDDFWLGEDVNCIGKLVQLREKVLETGRKGMPKWKIRLADDLVIQIQPQKKGSAQFIGVAVMMANASLDDLEAKKATSDEWKFIQFEIR